MDIHLEPFALLAVLDAATGPYFNEARHEFVTSYALSEDLLVRVDPRRVVQIVSNLLSNSVKYPGGQEDLDQGRA